MAVSTGSEQSVRVLGLGNEILADDAFGILVARAVERRFGGEAEVVESSDAGFNLLDRLVNVSRLLVVDTVQTGNSKPGTLHVYDSSGWLPVTGVSPHFTGLFEVLAVAKELGLRVPQVAIFAVEAADCFTVGGAMHEDVQAAIPMVVEWVGRYLENTPCMTPGHSGSS
jgi:hydrogenase maturation protease